MEPVIAQLYEDLDPGIRDAVRTAREVLGWRTLQSCEGHPAGYDDRSEESAAYIMVQLSPDTMGQDVRKIRDDLERLGFQVADVEDVDDPMQLHLTIEYTGSETDTPGNAIPIVIVWGDPLLALGGAQPLAD